MQLRKDKDMLLYELVEKCSLRDEYRCIHEQCGDCTYGNNCVHDCKECLKYVHFPTTAPAVREYDCVHMADCYYCKYAYKYASEIVYGLEQFIDIQNKKKLKVMSVGCGPCTELAAIDYLRQIGMLKYDELEYRGIDPLENVWGQIWNDIREYFGKEIRFFSNNVLELVDVIIKHNWVPDLIIFQYVFSDMYKHFGQREIEIFIEKLANYLNASKNKPVYVLANDINLSTHYYGGREFFDLLDLKIHTPKNVRKMHFDNINRDRHFEYGEEYQSNELIFDDISSKIKRAYNPFESCASAQILIKKQ